MTGGVFHETLGSMSRTTTLTVGDRGFWALNDAFGVWLAYMVEEIERDGGPEDPWLAALAEQWRVSSAITDFDADLTLDAPEQTPRIRAYAVAARRAAVNAGDITVQRLQHWMILPDIPVADGFSRTGDRVEVDRVLEVADAFIALLNGNFPPDPPTGAWFLGTGDGMRVIDYRKKPLPGESRFPRGRTDENPGRR